MLEVPSFFFSMYFVRVCVCSGVFLSRSRSVACFTPNYFDSTPRVILPVFYFSGTQILQSLLLGSTCVCVYKLLSNIDFRSTKEELRTVPTPCSIDFNVATRAIFGLTAD